MDRQSAQFYAAEIVLVLEYLRSQCVVHRCAVTCVTVPPCFLHAILV